jgi:hypothetical protein
MSGEKSDLPPDQEQIQATFVDKSRPQAMKNWEENVFQEIPVGQEETALVGAFLKAHDFVLGTRKGIILDLRKSCPILAGSCPETA